MRGKFKLRGDEHLRLSQQLIDANVATGYYFIGLFLKSGSAGLKQDPEMASALLPQGFLIRGVPWPKPL